MGKVRKHIGRRRASSLEDVAANLPDRLLDLSVDMVRHRMNGLRAYRADLEAHIGTELGRPANQKDVEVVMSKIGADFVVWAAIALGFPVEKLPESRWMASDAECG